MDSLERIIPAVRPAPIVVRQGNSATIVLGVVQGVWADVDPEGAPAARPLDVVIPNVKAGDWVEVQASISSPATAGIVYLDVATVVAGVAVNRFGASYGLNPDRDTAWVLQGNRTHDDLGNPKPYRLTAADIEGGAVRCRLRYNPANATARSILRGFGVELVLVGRGPLG